MPSGPLLLTLDRGNSTLDCMLHGTAPARIALPAESPDGFSRFLAGRRPDRAVGLSVVPAGLDRIAEQLEGLGVPLQLAGSDLPCPLTLDYRTPETLGVDRWVAALAAHRQFGSACVADLGTATTVDLVEASGVFRGGAIAPGLAGLTAALGSQAPELRVPGLDAGFSSPPDSSRSALAMGVQLGFCGMVERLVRELLGERGWPIVLTGGHAESYLRHGQLEVEHVPDLVHRGLVGLLGEACGC